MLLHRLLVAASALACAASSHAISPWTSFKVGTLDYNAFAVRPDGRFLYSEGGEIYSQNTFGLAAKTKINRGTLTFDPSFIAVRSSTAALLGAGGFSGSSGLHGFDPSKPSTAINSTPLATLQNYAAVWWRNPTTKREGWIIGGTNAAGGTHNLTFVSADGTKTGAITTKLCTYSAGLATDAAGNIFAALSEPNSSPDAADSEKVLKFTAAQIDSAVLSIINGAPVALAKTDGVSLFKFDASGSIAVDAFGRLWACGWQTNDLQMYDPATSQSYHITPVHSALVGAGGPPNYQVQTFTAAGVPYVAFLANDSFYSSGSDVIYGYTRCDDLPARTLSFSAPSQTKSEADGAISVTVNLSPAPLRSLTVPFTLSGTATKGSDFSIAITSLTFNPGETSKSIPVTILDDFIDEPIDNETVVLTLGTPSPSTHATVTQGVHTLTITDSDTKPVINVTQSFTVGRVGSDYSYNLAGSTGSASVTYKASNLPPGMEIDKLTGRIHGRATVAGEYDQVVITATSSAGVVTSRSYIINVDDYAAAAHGSFTGLIARGAATSNLGARIDISTTSSAGFTGKVIIGRTNYPISGPLDTSGANPSGTTTFKINNVTQTIALTIDATTGALSGSLQTTDTITGWRTLSSTALTGLHNFFAAVPGGPLTTTPEGTSFGSATVQANASTSISGKCADGSAFTSSGYLGTGGELAIYQALYSTPGTFAGTLRIANDAPHTCSGSIAWSKPGQTATQPYKTGWTPDISLTIKGGKYRAPGGLTGALGMNEATGYDAKVELQGGDASSISLSYIDVNITPGASIVISTPHRLTINNSTGAFSGLAMGTGPVHTVRGQLVADGIPVSYQGLIVPDTSTLDPYDGTGEGFFIYNSKSGAVSLTPVP